MSSKKKKISKAKKAKAATNQVKLTNKAASKKAQSRRKHKKLKSRLRRVDVKDSDTVKHAYKPVTAIVDVKEEVQQLEDDDVSFYGTPGHDVSFASTVRDNIISSKSDSKSKKRKKKSDGSDTEEYERLPRKLFSTTDNNNKKMVLPIKTKNGMVRERFEANEKPKWEVKEEVAESHDQADNQSDDESLPDISPLELYALRQEKLRKRKAKIATLCNSVMENPSENVGKLNDLIVLTEEKDADVYVTVRKLGMISLLEVFKDIIPGYPIRTLSNKEQGQQMKKETLSLTSSEDALLKYYREYLLFLHKTVKGSGQETNGFKVSHTVQQGLTEVALKCLCDLVVEHPHFNYREDIFGEVVNFMDSKIEKLSDMTCECVKKLFKGDKSGNVTLELTRVIGKMIKAKTFQVQPKVLNTFLSLRIKEVSYTDPIAKREEEKKRANLEKMSRKDKKRRKYMTLLERDMKETVATEDKRKRLKLHTETIQAVFLTYFRILKKAPGSNLLPSVLEGLAKYAHLISVDFFNDLFNVLNDLIEAETLSYRESLHCVQTAFTILTGQGSVLNIDPMTFYRHFYKSLFHVHAGTTSGDLPIILNSLDVMISQRKRQVSQQRILAFIKRLGVLALQQVSSGSVGILSALRTFFMTYKYADVLLDNETSGSGVYLQELEDPEHCNAHNAALWELNYLQHHYDPVVRRFALHLSKGAPSQGEGQLSMELRKSPIAMYDITEKKDPFEKEHSNKLSNKSKYRYRRQAFIQEDLQVDVEKVLESVMDSPQQDLIT